MASAPSSRLDFGIDNPQQFHSYWRRGIFFVLLGTGIIYANRETNPQGGNAVGGVVIAIGIVYFVLAALFRYGSTITRPAAVRKMISALPWRGDEKVLDVGCGRGLVSVLAAEKAPKGRVTGIDIWDKHALSGNTAEAARANLQAAGVDKLVKIETMDPCKLTYPNASFDTVLSVLALHRLTPFGREKALSEMLRVLKPGGRIAILDTSHVSEYAGFLEQNGAQADSPVAAGWLLLRPSHFVIAQKQ
jgi:SAM-dependent methyltransferase